MLSIPRLLIVAGTGTKSGKTSFACRLIEQFSSSGICSVKISPHFHQKTEGLVEIFSGEGYAAYLETNKESGKDTSRMLNAGASRVYLLLVWDSDVGPVFERLMKDIPENIPVVCESPSLRNYFEPGVFVIMSSGSEFKRQDLSHLQDLPHLKLKLQDLNGAEPLPVSFTDGRWRHT